MPQLPVSLTLAGAFGASGGTVDQDAKAAEAAVATFGKER